VGCRIEPAAFAIADGVQREQHLGGELRALFEDMVDGVGIDLGVRRKSLEFGGDVEQFVQNEVHVAQGRVVLTHGVLLLLLATRGRP
jgi:hypothetical protein